MSAWIRKPNKTGTWRYFTDNLYFLKGTSWITRGALTSGIREELGVCFQLGGLIKKPSGSQGSGKCAGNGRISFWQQIFPVSLFTSGQCKKKKKTKLKNWKMQLQIESVHVSCFPTLSAWNASRYASALSFKKICQWNKTIFFLTSKQTNKILILMAAFKQPNITF